MNRRERIERARKIEWRGYTDHYTQDLGFVVLNGILREMRGEPIGTIWFAGKRHEPTLTQLEDLSDKCCASLDAQEQARASK